MEKVIVFDRYKNESLLAFYRQTGDVVAFIAEEGEAVAGKGGDPDGPQIGEVPVVSLQEAVNLSFDKAVILQASGFEEKKKALREAGVPEEKIVYGGAFFGMHATGQLLQAMLADAAERGYDTLVDLGCHLADEHVLVSGGVPVCERACVRIAGCLLEGAGGEPSAISRNLYEEVYEDLEAVPAQKRSQCAYLGAVYRYLPMNSAMELAVMLLDVFQSIYLRIPFPDTQDHRAWQLLKGLKQITLREWVGDGDTLVRIEKKTPDTKTAIYVAMHKECAFYRSDTYLPLWLSAPESNPYGFTLGAPEPEIDALNPRINECTGLYRIWRHDTSEVKGLAHYGRYLASEWSKVQVPMEREEILHFLQRYDILVPQERYVSFPVRVQIAEILDVRIAHRAYEVYERLIAERQPDDLESFRRVMNGHGFYICNVFITRKEIFDRYCGWLFSFLTDAAKELDYDERTDMNRRVAGYMAERMLTVWLMRQDLRIKEARLITDYGADQGVLRT